MEREQSGKYMDHYRTWRPIRVQKIESILGKEFFKDKTILELACGYGDIGKHFRENLGAKVTFAEGRKEHLSFISENNPDSEVIHLNQENEWNLGKRFDVLIHFGVMYHLENWKQDLECALKHSDLIILESEIADSNDPKFEQKFIDPVSYDQSIHPEMKATRPSAGYVESVFAENGFSFIRYDDSDLNAGFHRYDWVVTGNAENAATDRNVGGGLRRFWIARK